MDAQDVARLVLDRLGNLASNYDLGENAMDYLESIRRELRPIAWPLLYAGSGTQESTARQDGVQMEVTTLDTAIAAVRAIIAYLESLGQGDGDEAVETAVSLLYALHDMEPTD